MVRVMMSPKFWREINDSGKSFSRFLLDADKSIVSKSREQRNPIRWKHRKAVNNQETI
jgi:hypothetical protein